MKFARLLLRNQLEEIISADKADYSDYQKHLLCCECGEPVFLRKAHFKGVHKNIPVQAAFVHHKLTDATPVCKDRVSKYTEEEIERKRTVARNQRLLIFQTSMWKILKNNYCSLVDLKHYSIFVKDTKNNPDLALMVETCVLIMEEGLETILGLSFDISANLFKNSTSMMEIPIEVKQFMQKRSRDWSLHCQIAKEALELFLSSPSMKELRYRLACCLSHPSQELPFARRTMRRYPPEKWQEQYTIWTITKITSLFLLVDWLGAWAEKS